MFFTKNEQAIFSISGPCTASCNNVNDSSRFLSCSVLWASQGSCPVASLDLFVFSLSRRVATTFISLFQTSVCFCCFMFVFLSSINDTVYQTALQLYDIVRIWRKFNNSAGKIVYSHCNNLQIIECKKAFWQFRIIYRRQTKKSIVTRVSKLSITIALLVWIS